MGYVDYYDPQLQVALSGQTRTNQTSPAQPTDGNGQGEAGNHVPTDGTIIYEYIINVPKYIEELKPSLNICNLDISEEVEIEKVKLSSAK